MKKHHVCPFWVAYTFLLPVRKLQHNPYKILKPYVKQGMTVMDYGCAMGYFSIPMARMTGPSGMVYCVDIQEKMLVNLQKRAARYKVADIIKTLLVNKNFNPEEMAGKLDFVLLFFVAHEVPDQKSLFTGLHLMLKNGGKVLFAEPKGHVSEDDFRRSLRLAEEAGLTITGDKPLRSRLSVILRKD
ncbi:MAG TPA: methyltransferase domain-containing protein [Bacteroidales bacterium]|nr:methyltransferase domain-containing protein [Bacteroidales bacterium]HRR93090.1 methyltransferase domain-containing protein [Bacteroidales bacterium]HRT89511.1 methyltransferase domain-containing protein [Bacteroidales bacterium]